jgi:hypothetical protein
MSRESIEEAIEVLEDASAEMLISEHISICRRNQNDKSNQRRAGSY